MASVHEQLTEQFRLWERRGRGWEVFDFPVAPEPPFVPFRRHYPQSNPVTDDGRRATPLSSLVQRLSRKLSTDSQPPRANPEIEEAPEPDLLQSNALTQHHLTFPA